ncbi:MAG: energy transducer TonB [Deltaproteobacteria bacterium]|nr:energy transducer TonB [Deltaproteobacteria bacterium]
MRVSSNGQIKGQRYISSKSGVAGQGTGSSSVSPQGNYYGKHFAYIKDIIQKNLSYPYKAKMKGWAGTVMVSFIILENGQVKNIHVIKSSGYEVLDNNVIETIKAVAPFPQPPITAELQMPICYRLER